MLSPMFEELSPGVFRRPYPFLRMNVGVVLGEEGVLLIDTRESHEAAGELIGDLRSLTPKPVRWILNTHWHWDHIFGNSCFRGATIWGHRLCRRALRDRPEQHRKDARKWTPEERHREMDRVEILPPDRTFEAVTSIDLGGRLVKASYHGRGHTDADIAIHCGGGSRSWAISSRRANHPRWRTPIPSIGPPLWPRPARLSAPLWFPAMEDC